MKKSGPHQVLMACYAIFVLAAGARSAVQLSTKFHVAPVAYVLSAVAAVTYALGWFAIRRASQGEPRFAWVMLSVELTGVLTVGTLSLVQHSWFPRGADAQSVWSAYGMGYGWVPAALPLLGIWWLVREHRAATA